MGGLSDIFKKFFPKKEKKTIEAVKAANEATIIEGETAPRLYTRGVALVADGKLAKGFKDFSGTV